MKMISIASIAALLAAASTPAVAGESSSAWGTMGYTSRAQVSANLHKTEGDNAQIATIGREVTSMYRSISSCGYCVYNQITGDSNSINGNSITGSNSGRVSSTGTFGSN